MGVKKNPVSPRQRMINLMYVVLTAMLALNVSTDVLKGLSVVSDSLERSTSNAEKENLAIYEDFKQQMQTNPAKVGPWFEKARGVKSASDSLCAYADLLKWAIAREADGRDGNPLALENKDDLNASDAVMLNGPKKHGRRLFEEINKYRNFILGYVTDPRQRAIIASNLSTEVPKTAENRDKAWQEYMFETMPAIAAVTMLSKLESDVRKAESEVLHNLISNVDVKDIRVNHNGDRMSGSKAMRKAQKAGLKVVEIVIHDDIAQGPDTPIEDKRGLGGVIPFIKVVGAAAEAGKSLDEIVELANKFNEGIATLSVALKIATHPQNGGEIGALADDEMEIGMGQHGEGGGGISKMCSADETVEKMLPSLVKATKIASGDKALLLINGSGSTTTMEMLICFIESSITDNIIILSQS